MNKQEPAGLTVGPLMDAKVAECLGWEVELHDSPPFDVGLKRVSLTDLIGQPVPPFSTDDGTAFTHLWPWLCERAHPILYGSRTLDDTVVQVMANRGWEEAVEPTVALALCKAVIEVAKGEAS